MGGGTPPAWSILARGGCGCKFPTFPEDTCSQSHPDRCLGVPQPTHIGSDAPAHGGFSEQRTPESDPPSPPALLPCGPSLSSPGVERASYLEPSFTTGTSILGVVRGSPSLFRQGATRPSTVCLFSSPTPDSLEARSGLVLWRPCRSAPGTYLPEGLCREQGGEFNVSKGLSNGNIHPHNTSTQMFVATS